MFKMGSHDSFEFLKHKLWSKEGQKSNWQFDFQPLKSYFRWRATYCWKYFDEGY